MVAYRNVNRKSYALFRMVTFSMTLTDPSPVFQVHGIFEMEYLKTARPRDKVRHTNKESYLIYRMVP